MIRINKTWSLLGCVAALGTGFVVTQAVVAQSLVRSEARALLNPFTLESEPTPLAGPIEDVRRPPVRDPYRPPARSPFRP